MKNTYSSIRTNNYNEPADEDAQHSAWESQRSQQRGGSTCYGRSTMSACPAGEAGVRPLPARSAGKAWMLRAVLRGSSMVTGGENRDWKQSCTLKGPVHRTWNLTASWNTLQRPLKRWGKSHAGGMAGDSGGGETETRSIRLLATVHPSSQQHRSSQLKGGSNPAVHDR